MKPFLLSEDTRKMVNPIIFRVHLLKLTISRICEHVNRADQKFQLNSCGKSVKWWKRIINYIVEVVTNNALIIENEHN